MNYLYEQLQDLKDAITLKYMDIAELSPEEAGLIPVIEADIEKMIAEFNERAPIEWLPLNLDIDRLARSFQPHFEKEPRAVGGDY